VVNIGRHTQPVQEEEKEEEKLIFMTNELPASENE